MSVFGKKIYLVLDIGTSYIKCGCIDPEYNVVASYQREFPMVQNQRLFEIDFDLFFETANELIKECLSDRLVNQYKVEALLITSQAQTSAPADENFKPLRKGIVWLDERAEKEAAYLREMLKDFSRASGFKRPFPGLYIAKLLWLKWNEAAVFRMAKTFPLINEYLAYRLSGKFYSDSGGIGMSGMYDFRFNEINKDILEIIGLEEDNFPQIEKAATQGELILPEFRQQWSINYGFPVFLCGNDQGASASGAGLKRPGDININFGTAIVFYTITDSLVSKLTDSQIAGKHPTGDNFFLLNFGSDFGIQIRSLKEKYFKNES